MASSAFGVYKGLVQSPDLSSSASSSFGSSLEGGLTDSVKAMIGSAGDTETTTKRSERKRKHSADERTPLQKKVESNLKRKYGGAHGTIDDELSPILAGHVTTTIPHGDEVETDGRKAKTKKKAKVKNGSGKKSKIRVEEDVDQKKKFQPVKKMNRSESIEEKEEEVVVTDDSSVDGRKVLAWLINPVKTRKFFQDIWEKKPLLIKRHKPKFYRHIFSGKEVDRILDEGNVEFGTNVDIALYKDGQRFTLNPEGRAHPSLVWKFYQDGCSIRLLNPQTYCDSLWQLCSRMQEFFGSFVGANAYLTPRKAQGFAPHYDDIEAFVMQIEGKKRWKVYTPRNDSEILPRHSSPNFSQEDLGDPILEVVLEPGDMLYFPRGYIHQAQTVPKHHSLHITLSTYQLNSWTDLLQKLLPAALQVASEEDAEFRQGLPLDYMSYMGLVHSDKKSSKRVKFLSKLKDLVTRLPTFAPVDAAADQMLVDFTQSCLPPRLSADERLRTIHGVGPRWSDAGLVDVASAIVGSTKVRLLRRSIARLVMESETLRLYYSVDNSRVYQEKEAQFLELTEEEAMGFECLANSYPKYVEIESLPLEDPEERVAFARTLFNKGILSTETPLDLDYV